MLTSGQAKAPETLDWLQKLFGKVKQVKEGVTIRRNETTINMNEQMDFVIPADLLEYVKNTLPLLEGDLHRL